MRLRQIFESTSAAMLVAATLALSAPGVQVARADDAERDRAEFARFAAASSQARAGGAQAPAESCGAGQINPVDARMAHLMAALRKQEEARAARDARPGEQKPATRPRVVVLNNRGYNYADPAQP